MRSRIIEEETEHFLRVPPSVEKGSTSRGTSRGTSLRRTLFQQRCPRRKMDHCSRTGQAGEQSRHDVPAGARTQETRHTVDDSLVEHGEYVVRKIVRVADAPERLLAPPHGTVPIVR